MQIDPNKPWSEGAKRKFGETLRDCTELETVRFTTAPGTEETHALFKQEIDFYAKKKMLKHLKTNKF